MINNLDGSPSWPYKDILNISPVLFGFFPLTQIMHSPTDYTNSREQK